MTGIKEDIRVVKEEWPEDTMMADVTRSAADGRLPNSLHVKEEIIDDFTTDAGASYSKPGNMVGIPREVTVKNEWLEEDIKMGDVTTDSIGDPSYSCLLIKEESRDDVPTAGAGYSKPGNTAGIFREVTVKNEWLEEQMNIGDATLNNIDDPSNNSQLIEGEIRDDISLDIGSGTSLFDGAVGNTERTPCEEGMTSEESYTADRTMNGQLISSSEESDDVTMDRELDSTVTAGFRGESIHGHFLGSCSDDKSNLRNSLHKEEGECNPSKKPYACDTCSYRTHRQQTLKLHIMRNHTDEKPFSCEQCDYKCCKRSQLKRHMLKHSGKKPYACDLCDYQCTKSEYLKAHKIAHFRGDLSCNTCDYVCQRLQDLKAHEKIHTGENKFSCIVCEIKFDSAVKLECHMTNHPEVRPFACDFCDYRSNRAHRLKLHMMRHTGEKPLACGQCDYRSSDTSTLRRHLQAHSGEKPFSCDVCDYRCARAGRMKTHMKTHTGVKLFSCGDCDYKTSDSSTLKRHMKTHTGDKPFSCDLCDYRCRRASHLKSHMKNHRVQS